MISRRRYVTLLRHVRRPVRRPTGTRYAGSRRISAGAAQRLHSVLRSGRSFSKPHFGRTRDRSAAARKGWQTRRVGMRAA